VLDDYQKERILVFFNPGRDPLGAGWNKIQSEIAVGSGGLTGKGYLKGTQNVLGYLPRTVAPTDFIYSVIAEEMGFLGSSLILALYAAILVAGVRVAWRAPDTFGRLLTMGVVTMLFSHVFVNVAMTIGLMPITGLPLPLISYGGSFMLSTMLALGMVQSVNIRRVRR
jgi:rod shape determining protein RodA